jgi:hypothetical protein
MIWVCVAIGWAATLVFCLGLCCAAADAETVANLLLTREEINCEQQDHFEMSVLVSMDDYR